MQKDPARHKAAENKKKKLAGWTALSCLALAALLALPGTAEELAPEASEVATLVETEIVEDEGAEAEEPCEAEAIETAVPAALEIHVDGAELDEAGVWRIPAGVSAAFTWDCPDAEAVSAAIYDADGAIVWEGAPGAGSLLLANADWQENGPYRLRVTARYPDGVEAMGEIAFAIEPDEDAGEEAEAEDAGEPEAADVETSEEEVAEETEGDETTEDETTEDGTTEDEAASEEETETNSGSGKSSGKSSSGKSSGGKSSGRSASGKSSGSKSSGGKSAGKTGGKATAGTEEETAVFTVPDGPVTALMLGETELGISLDGGEASFTATLADGVLTLTPVEAGDEWRLNSEALAGLYAQGIDAVALTLDGETWRVDTAEAAETDAGDADVPEVLWIVDADGVRLRAGGMEFRWTPPEDAE